MIDIKKEMLETGSVVNQKIDILLKNTNNKYINYLIDSMKYSVNAGGKRVRPFLVSSFCEMFGGNIEEAYDFSVAIELIHTYSLIHDDLPCMDNDDLRRGVPTNHKVYGEQTALLAGDALLTLAFGFISSSVNISDSHKIAAVGILADCAGYKGMIGGQQMDIMSTVNNTSYEEMITAHELKTCQLIIASCKLGLLSCSGISSEIYDKCIRYAMGIGRLFQLTDDLLDRYADEKEFGKNVGSDDKNNKVTYFTFVPEEIALGLADLITEESKKCICDIPNSEKLLEFADYIRNRKK
jgi:geranylgeranyl diphosphate synthase type II